MPRRAPKILLALAPLLALVACQDPDVGNECTLTWNARWEQQGTTPPPSAAQLHADDAAADYFDSGNFDCEGLVCIVSPAESGTRYGSSTPGRGYCSKTCISNDQCYPKDTGLECRQMVLDDVFLRELDESTRQRYLADIESSSYCAVPR